MGDDSEPDDMAEPSSPMDAKTKIGIALGMRKSSAQFWSVDINFPSKFSSYSCYWRFGLLRTSD